MTLDIAVIGGGAMGGLWAGRLARAGANVVVVDPAQPVVDAVRERGLRIEARDGTFVAHPAIAPDATGLTPVDVAFVFVKAHHTPAAARTAASLATDRTLVVSLQNGWGNAEVLARTIDPAQLLLGVTYHSATLIEPGVVNHTAVGPTFLGAYLGEGLDKAQQVGQLLGTAGIDVTITPDVRTEIWRKLVLNAATLPTAALTGLTAGQVGEPGPLLELVDALARETVAVARAMGLAIDEDERIDRIHTVLAGAGSGRPSMLQDVLARKKTEIEVINGAVVRAADEVGVAAPLNRALTALISGLERSWSD